MIKKSIVEAKFKRSSLNLKHTFLWSSLPENIKGIVESKIEPEVKEDIVVCFFQTNNYFWVLSTSRLIIFDVAHTFYYPLNSIKKIGLNELLEGKTTKSANNSLNITLMNNISFTIKVEELAWPTIYNLLRFMILRKNN